MFFKHINKFKKIKKNLWPTWCSNNIYEGFSNFALEELAKPKLGGWEKKGNKLIPSLFWPTEVYSFGKCYREWIDWPYWLPIPIYADHGVCLKGVLAPHEKENKAKFHATWFKERAIFNQENSIKQVIRIPHPWIVYRRKENLSINKNAYGTLVFFVHSTMNIDLFIDLEKYISDLEKLPINYKPLVFCVHMHDIKKGIHYEIKKFGYPVITIGNTSSFYFVDRFYDIVKNFAHATSNVGGSELFYCYEMGINYFLYGNKPQHYNHSDANLPKGYLGFTDKIQQQAAHKKEELFRLGSNVTEEEKQCFVRDVLGLDLDPIIARDRLKKIFWKEILRLLPFYFAYVIRRVVFLGQESNFSR